MSGIVTIYHNPRCSKSRETLALLNEKGVTPRVIRYLDTPPDVATLLELMASLGFSSPRQIMRHKEDIYRTLNLADPDISDAALLEAIVKHPILLERPIVVAGDLACIGRPPEQVLTIL